MRETARTDLQNNLRWSIALEDDVWRVTLGGPSLHSDLFNGRRSSNELVLYWSEIIGLNLVKLRFTIYNKIFKKREFEGCPFTTTDVFSGKAVKTHCARTKTQ